MKILIAEDEPALRYALQTLLQRNHYTSDAVDNGHDALEFLRIGYYDAAILDIMMPKMDGIQVIERLRQDGIKTPVLLLTAKASVEDRVAGMTNDLVVLAKAEEFSSAITVENFSFSNMVNEIAEFYYAPVKSKGIRLNTVIPKNLNYRGSQKELEQLLCILLDNATKYCPQNGQIDLTVRKELRGVNIQIVNTAEDTGAYPNNIFTQRFFRGENAAGKEGSGLGLSIGQTIVDRHKGKLTVTTGEDTFCVCVMLH